MAVWRGVHGLGRFEARGSPFRLDHVCIYPPNELKTFQITRMNIAQQHCDIRCYHLREMVTNLGLLSIYLGYTWLS